MKRLMLFTLQNGEAFFDQCGECVGGTTNKQPCQEDCAGVWGGKAYLNECNECVNGNLGKFNYTLQNEDLAKYNEIISLMQQNCLDALLLNGLNDFSGITIGLNSDQSFPGYDPCKESISFKSIDEINLFSVRAELFHAYQNQFYEGKLAQVYNDLINNHIGGSNIEFEEKAIGMLSYYYDKGIMISFEGTASLQKLLFDIFENPNYELVEFSDSIKERWFITLNEFRNYHMNTNTTFYGKPIDPDLFPAAFFHLVNMFFTMATTNSNCVKELTITPK